MLNNALKLLACMAVFLNGSLLGQGTDQLLTTVGTTVEKDGRIYAYLLWQPGQAKSTLGKRFAIYSKPGAIGTAGDFTRLGIQTLQTSPSTIRALLELGEKVDVAGDSAAARIDGIYRDVTLRADSPPADPAEPNLDAAGKLVFLIQSAVTDSKLLGNLFFLGRAHPGVMMALGHAFCIEVKGKGVTTYEVREVDGSDASVQVLGRVALDPSSPVVLDAPGPPIAVPHPVKAGSQYPVNPKDHLNARFRWGVGTALREKMPYSFGFDLFRVKRLRAIQLGWHASPPDPEVMLQAVEGMDPTDPNPDFSRVNALPIMMGDFLTLAQAADLSDRERIDLADDGIWYEGPDGSAVRRPYSDGEVFYYFAAARGITGLPGTLSAGTEVTMCDRLPPNPPAIVSVLGKFTPPSDPADWVLQGGTSALQVKFRQVPGATVEEKATGYYIYRWSTSQQYLDSPGNPVINRVAYVPHIAEDVFQTWTDDGAGAPTLATHTDTSVWYTVRAVGASSCASLVYSGHSAPMAGVLRDFKAPDAPTGTFLVCRAYPRAEGKARSPERPDQGVPADFEGITVEVKRDDSAVVAAKIEVRTGKTEATSLLVYSKLHYFQKSSQILANLRIREPYGNSNRFQVSVEAVTATGLYSSPATIQSPIFEVPQTYGLYPFTAGVTKRCEPIETVLDNPPVHESRDPNGKVNAITGTIFIPLGQGVKEWRVYRRIGPDGELSLIAKKEGELPDSSTWEDDTPPNANGAEVCYFYQVFDQNANPSVPVRIGCVTMANPDLPTPMQSPATAEPAPGDKAVVKLEWFCDPVGVDRFEILVAQDGGGAPEISGLSDLLDDAPIGSVSDEFSELSFYPFQTARITQSFGPGPDFGLEVEIPADKVLYFAIRACGPGVFPRASGAASNVVQARWETPVEGEQPVIPWPARPLPGSNDARRNIVEYQLGEGPLWPMILPEDYLTPTAILVGVLRENVRLTSTGKGAFIAGTTIPEQRLFQLRDEGEAGTSVEDLMPFMLYRYQEPSSVFPDAKPNLVQCTPLIDRMSWKEIVGSSSSVVPDGMSSAEVKKTLGYDINDPYFLLLGFSEMLQVPISGEWDDNHQPVVSTPQAAPELPPYLQDATGVILVRDPLPVIQGAKYRHLIVRFTDRGEIRHVIPIDPVQH